ncbi:hypothetical protein BDF22DRAFT_494877 [Syncephalis plumigaleata]|nr:hypothetical protein BDF22DRAFT_494877 [Syncephalis plumigaleata]
MPTLQPKNSRMVVPHQHRVTDASTSNTAKRSTSDNIEGFVNATKLIDAAEKKQRELQNTTTPGYAYKEVVRNKEERKSMTATTCVNCDKFHKAAGPIMPFDELGSPFNKRKGHTSGHECKHNQQQQSRQIEDKDKEDEQQMANQARLQQISRHRDRHPPSRRRATSPIDYWDPEFPNTEEIEAMRAKNQTFVQSS